jgi:hypothetical protein
VRLKEAPSGEPEIADKAPVEEFKVYPEIFCEPEFPA